MPTLRNSLERMFHTSAAANDAALFPVKSCSSFIIHVFEQMLLSKVVSVDDKVTLYTNSTST